VSTFNYGFIFNGFIETMVVKETRGK